MAKVHAWTVPIPGKKSGCQSSIYSTFMVVKLEVSPQGDKGILANPVTLTYVIMSELKGIYDMKRGITEVRFDNQFEPINLKFRRIRINM